MRGLQGFASQAAAAYTKLDAVITKLIPTVAALGDAFGRMRAELRTTLGLIDSTTGSLNRMRGAIATTIPLVGVLVAQFGQLGVAAKGSSLLAANGMTSLAASAGKAAATMGAANTGLLAALGPMALLAAAAGAVYVAMFKWGQVPTLLKPILLLLSPIVLAIRAMATAWSLATAPFRAFSAAVGAAQSVVSGLVRAIVGLPSLLASITVGLGRMALSLGQSIVSAAMRAGAAVKSFVGGVLQSVGRLGSLLQSLGDSVLAVANRIVGPLTQAAEGFARAGTAVAAFAAATGLSVQAVQALGYAAEQSGASVEDVAAAVESVNAKLAEATAGSDSAAQAFRQLGLDVNRLAAMSPEDRFAEIGVAIASLEDPLERAKAAQDAFGSSNANLVEMFAKGKAGLAEMRAEAERLGLVMGQDQVAAAKELTAANKFLRDSLTGLWRTLGAAVAPKLAATAREMATVVRSVTAWGRANQPLISQVFRVASTIAGVATGLTTVASALAVATPGVLALSAALAAGWVAWGRYGDGFKAALGGTVELLTQFYEESVRVLGGVWDAIKAGDLELAVEIAWLGAKKAWYTGLSDLATVTNSTLGGILNSLASGDWRSALDQSWTAIKLGLSSVMQAIDEQWTALQDTVDAVITSVRQSINVVIQEIARLAMQSAQTLGGILEAVAKYDPTGKARNARDALGDAVRGSGLGGLTRGAEQTNAGLGAERDARVWTRAADLASRTGARGVADAAMQGKLADQQNQARGFAGNFGADVNAQLNDAIRRAMAAANAADQRSAEEIDRRRRLEAGSSARAAGGGFGALFSGAALLAVAGGGGPLAAQDRTAKATERAAKSTEKLVELAQERGQVRPALVWKQ